MNKKGLKDLIKINKAEAEQFRESGRKKTKKYLKKLNSVVKVFLVVVIILGLLFIGAKQFANVSMSNINDWVKGIFLKSSPGEGYPYTVSDKGVIQSELVGPYLALVEKDKLLFLNSHAKDIFTYEHNFVDPVLKTKNGRAVFYCEGTSDFVITSSSEILYGYDKTANVLDGGIITADIGRKGNVAFVTWSDEFACKISVYNQKLKEVFYFGFSSGRVVDLSLSDDGQYLCAAVIDAQNATLFTRLMVFDLSKSEPISDIKLDNQTAVNIEFLSGSNIELITMSSVYAYDFRSDSEPDQTIDFSGSDIDKAAYDPSGGRVSIAIKQYASNRDTVFLFNSSGTKYKTREIDAVKSISRSSKYTVCLTDHKIFCIKNSSRQLFEIDLNVNVDDVLVDSGKMFVFSGNQIYKVGLSRFTNFEIN